MVHAVSSLIEQYICPIMDAHGYSYQAIPQDGAWEFVKKGERAQIIAVEQYCPKTLRLSLRLIPSFLHHDMEVEAAYWDNHDPKPNALLGGWHYRTQKELADIIQCIAKAIEERALPIMDAALQDPRDFCPTKELEQTLYLHHQMYAELFAKRHHFRDWEPEPTAQAIMDELQEIPEQVDLSRDREHLLRLAAAYGSVFEKQGATWGYTEERMCCLVFSRRSPLECPCKVYPFVPIFHWLHYRQELSIQWMMENDLLYVRS